MTDLAAALPGSAHQLAILRQTAQYVQRQLAQDTAGHDWWHVYRVWRTASALAGRTAADPFIVQLAALLHDIADWKFHAGDEAAGPRQARAWLEQCGVEPAVIGRVCDIIRQISFKGAGVPDHMDTLEGQLVQDADRLDALGAIGIARAFAYGGYRGRALYDPAAQPEKHTSFEQYRANQSSTIHHFYEKLLLLKDRLNTAAARELAEPRHAFMLAFLDQFMAEWEDQPNESLKPG